jgi:hypothetical protein
LLSNSTQSRRSEAMLVLCHDWGSNEQFRSASVNHLVSGIRDIGSAPSRLRFPYLDIVSYSSKANPASSENRIRGLSRYLDVCKVRFPVLRFFGMRSSLGDSVFRPRSISTCVSTSREKRQVSQGCHTRKNNNIGNLLLLVLEAKRGVLD